MEICDLSRGDWKTVRFLADCAVREPYMPLCFTMTDGLERRFADIFHGRVLVIVYRDSFDFHRVINFIKDYRRDNKRRGNRRDPFAHQHPFGDPNYFLFVHYTHPEFFNILPSSLGRWRLPSARVKNKGRYNFSTNDLTQSTIDKLAQIDHIDITFVEDEMMRDLRDVGSFRIVYDFLHQFIDIIPNPRDREQEIKWTLFKIKWA